VLMLVLFWWFYSWLLCCVGVGDFGRVTDDFDCH
jgi:hypothetical protein